jgi:membrane-bound lytic murein transglycosylase D
MPHVESSFNPRAYSSVGAAGLWQFTRSTGRLYMRVDYEIDERMDPFLATDAAARLLLDNYAELKTWPLAVTAYNHGQAGMSRAVRATGTRDIATIVRRYKGPSFKFASRNFYTELLAAIDVDRDAEAHFGILEKLDPAAYETVKLDHYYRVQSLERVLGIDATRLREENLSLQPPVWRGQKYVPRGFKLRIPRHPRGVPAATALASIPPAERFTRQKRDTVYRVQRGDTLSQIAKRHGVKESELMALNSLRSRHRIRIGQKLRLPADDAPSMPPGDFDGTYYVRSGDSLSRIAKRFHVSEDAIVAANGLRNKNQLSVGQKLLVPVPSLTAAASEPARPPARTAPTPAAAGLVPGAPAGVIVARAEPAEDGQPRVRVTLPAVQPAEALPWADPDASTEADARAAVGGLESTLTPTPAVEPEAAPAVVGPPAVALAPSPAAPLSPAPEAAPGLASPAPPPPDTPEDVLAGLDLAVSRDDHIVVEAGETLGHYADWLQISTSRLRSLNSLRPRAALVIGQRVRLDFSRVARPAFAARRSAHHESIRANFFARYRVAGTQEHVLRRGDTLWSLSRRHRSVPIWLLREYNPDVDLTELQPGLRIQIPRLERINT